ncbi:MAG: molybdopterin molybdotransferase MoeA [Synergistaceae bacterium]|jgi:molybdopterin molybdotransferase|nr:molybdopterin molybdotransferase MoeA [Synergistaceae bacterium]
MSGFVEEARSIDDCLRFVAEALRFPWNIGSRRVKISDALLTRSSIDMIAPEPYPPFTRSLRDGYALRHSDTTGASPSSPAFLKAAGEILMGNAPSFAIAQGEAAYIPTGGMMPDGADSVAMVENTAASGSWVEVRASVQSGENVMREAEEIAEGDVLIRKGELMDHSSTGLLATFGISKADVMDIKIAVISTGDEITPIETSPLPNGFIRDANTSIIQSTLKRYGMQSESYGIAPDRWPDLKARTEDALARCSVVLLSGGSSVGAQDHTIRLIESMSEPGLLVRGINMAPGKPTLIGGSAHREKLIVGLPGHPLSCMVSTIFVVLPLLLALGGARSPQAGRYIRLPLTEDVQGRTGQDEFIPMSLDLNGALPLAAKSGYVSTMRGADGFIRMRPDTETQRKGEMAEIWLW